MCTLDVEVVLEDVIQIVVAIVHSSLVRMIELTGA